MKEKIKGIEIMIGLVIVIPVIALVLITGDPSVMQQ